MQNLYKLPVKLTITQEGEHFHWELKLGAAATLRYVGYKWLHSSGCQNDAEECLDAIAEMLLEALVFQRLGRTSLTDIALAVGGKIDGEAVCPVGGGVIVMTETQMERDRDRKKR